MKTAQYTVRGIPDRVDKLARRRAKATHKSLNTVLVEALSQGLGAGEEKTVYHDLDSLAGTWVHDPAFDAAMEAFESVDEDMWK